MFKVKISLKNAHSNGTVALSIGGTNVWNGVSFKAYNTDGSQVADGWGNTALSNLCLYGDTGQHNDWCNNKWIELRISLTDFINSYTSDGIVLRSSLTAKGTSTVTLDFYFDSCYAIKSGS